MKNNFPSKSVQVGIARAPRTIVPDALGVRAVSLKSRGVNSYTQQRETADRVVGHLVPSEKIVVTHENDNAQDVGLATYPISLFKVTGHENSPKPGMVGSRLAIPDREERLSVGPAGPYTLPVKTGKRARELKSALNSREFLKAGRKWDKHHKSLRCPSPDHFA